MPLGIVELRSLQTLSKIIIGCENGFEIAKLKDLKNLNGKISIVGLDKVKDALHAREANFSQKRLSEFEVVWSDVAEGSGNEILEKEVFNELKPSNDSLKQLKIWSYGGLEFPNWVGDPSFLRLKHVSIRGCKKCVSLPPAVGQLQSLKELFIEED
ncbi:putative leucine-rich repeat domain superfamily [Helianthus debilis subsp. tardiflorus]